MTNKPKPITNPTYHVVSGNDPHEKTEQMRRWTEYPKRGTIKEFPLQLDIESTSACNLKCPMCAQADEETRPVVENMSFDLYTHIIDEGARKGLDSIKMQYRGEPLITGDIAERVAYATERGIQATFNTNGTLLTKDLSTRLIDAGLYKIMFSVDSHIPEEYERIRVLKNNDRGNFGRVLRNIRDMIRIRGERNSKYPIIRVGRVDLPETRDSIGEFSEFWREQGVDLVSIVDLNDLSMGTKQEEVTTSTEFSCEQPWQRLFVLAGGDVVPCCGDWYQQMPLGHIVLPKQIQKFKSELEGRLKYEEVGSIVELKITKDPKLERTVIGIVKKDRQVEPTEIRIRGITGLTHTVPLVNSIESIWTGERLNYIRERNKEGESHKVPICADCGLRNTVIEKRGLDSKKESRGKKHSEPKKHELEYIKNGLQN